jgi:hypothetical protein
MGHKIASVQGRERLPGMMFFLCLSFVEIKMAAFRYLSFWFIASGICGSLSGQSVRDIRAISQEEVIRISYSIEGSQPSQFFFVTLSCILEGGTRIEPTSLRGDIGHGIPGGQTEYTIIWDPGPDFERMKKATYEIRATLERDLDQVTTPVPITTGKNYRIVEPGVREDEIGTADDASTIFERRMFASYNGSLSSPYGMSIGTIRNWGFYTSFRFGGTVDDREQDVWFTAIGGATKYIFGSSFLRLHGYAGLGVSVEAYKEYGYDTDFTDSFFSMDAGVTGVIGFLNLTLGADYIFSRGAGLVFGIGFVF